jgi:hypothetical protein
VAAASWAMFFFYVSVEAAARFPFGKQQVGRCGFLVSMKALGGAGRNVQDT